MRSLFLLGLSLLAACGGSTSNSGFDPDASASSSSSSSSSSSGGTSGSLGSSGSGGDGGSSGSTGGATLLYAHTDTTLYSFNPDDLTAAPTMLGDFDCIGSGKASAMTDIGVTKDGKLYGVSESAAYPLTIGSGTVHCDTNWPLPSTARFYGLTIAPENTVAAAEVVIAANGNGELYQLDATSGTPTQVGTLGTDPISGKTWALSGDIVFLANSGSPIGFATVRTCTGTGTSNCDTTDTLVEVNVSAIKPGTQSVLSGVRGAVKKGASCANPASPATFGSMFGIAAFGAKVYGFSRKGDVVEIDNNDGSGCLVASYPKQLWAGAGVTTVAPVTAPPPK